MPLRDSLKSLYMFYFLLSIRETRKTWVLTGACADAPTFNDGIGGQLRID